MADYSSYKSPECSGDEVLEKEVAQPVCAGYSVIRMLCPTRQTLGLAWLFMLGASSVQAGSSWSWLSPEWRRIETERQSLETKLLTLPPAPPPQVTQRLGWHSDYSASPDTVEWMELNLGQPESLDAVVLMAPPPAAGAAVSGYGFPLRFRVELLGVGEETQRRVLADYTQEDFPNPGQLPVVISAHGHRAQKVRITATRLFREDQRYLFALGEVMLFQGPHNLAARIEAVGPSHAFASSSQGTRPDWGRINVVDGHSVVGPPLGPRPSPSLGFRSKPVSERKATSNPWVTVDLGEVMPVEEVRLFPAQPPQFAHSHGYGFPVHYEIELRETPESAAHLFPSPQSGGYVASPGDNPVVIPTAKARARWVQLKVLEPHVSNGGVVLALAEMQVWSGGQNRALGKTVLASDQTETGGWSKAALVDGFASGADIVEAPGWLAGLSARREAMQGLKVLEARQAAVMRELQAVGWGLLALLVCVILLILLGVYLRQRRARRKELEDLRQRISQDLHDEIGSSLGSIMLITEDALTAVREGEMKEDLQEIRETARQTMDSMRDIVRLAQTGSYGGDDLVAHLREIADRMLRGLSHTFSADEVSPPPMDLRRDLVLMFKETLHNLQRHAQATQAEITLRRGPGTLVLRVRDNGCGFQTENVSRGGMGLTNLQRRAAKHGGSAIITSAPGQGTTVSITFPRHG